MSDTLNYASPTTQSPALGWGYVLLLLINSCSLCVISFAIFREATSGGQGMIGDAYGPLIGLLIGAPYAAGQLLIGTIPSAIYASSHFHAATRRLIVTLLVISVLALVGIGSLTAACIMMPRTHGSSC